MSPIAPLRPGRQSRLRLAYALAVLLPVLGTVLTQHMAFLHGIPNSTNLLAVVIVGILGGLSPSMAAIAVAVLTRILYLSIIPDHSFSFGYELLHVVIMFAAAFVVWFMNRNRRHSEEKLEATLVALQERTDDLVSSLNSSRCACWTLDLDSGRSERWYSGSYQLYGRPYSEFEQLSSLQPLVHPEDDVRLRELMVRMRTSWEPVIFEHRVIWPNGEIHTLEMRGNRVAGRGCVWRGVTLDITERKKTKPPSCARKSSPRWVVWPPLWRTRSTTRSSR